MSFIFHSVNNRVLIVVLLVLVQSCSSGNYSGRAGMPDSMRISLMSMKENQLCLDSVKSIAGNFVFYENMFDLSRVSHVENNILVCKSRDQLMRCLNQYMLAHLSGELLQFYKDDGFVIVVFGEGDRFLFLAFDKSEILVDYLPKY